MKSIVITVLMLSMKFIFVNCENEGQLTESTSDVERQILDKKPQKGELIIFKEGDLAGNEIVSGCCPNAGPWPAYKMTLSGTFPAEISGILLEGNIFMNSTGRQSPGDYIVQFWWGDIPNNYFIEIRGGEKQYDRRNKILTVTFTNAQCVIDGDTVRVNFTLTRAKL